MTGLVEGSIDEALAPMQALASRLWSQHSRHHPGRWGAPPTTAPADWPAR